MCLTLKSNWFLTKSPYRNSASRVPYLAPILCCSSRLFLLFIVERKYSLYIQDVTTKSQLHLFILSPNIIECWLGVRYCAAFCQHNDELNLVPNFQEFFQCQRTCLVGTSGSSTTGICPGSPYFPPLP